MMNRVALDQDAHMPKKEGSMKWESLMLQKVTEAQYFLLS